MENCEGFASVFQMVGTSPSCLAVEIDLDKVSSEVSDVSGGFPNGGRMSNWARADQEVLIKDHVPAEAIRPIE